MATFRKYGGTNYSPIANIVRHNMFNSKSSSFMTSGSYNSKENFLSHVDMSGNSLLHVGNIYFQDGTSISSGSTDPSLAPYGLASVLNNSTDGGGFNISNINDLSINGSLQIGGKTQTSTYSGFNIAGTYNNATLTFDTNGKITNVIDTSLSPFGLADVLDNSEDGGNLNISNINDLSINGSLSQTNSNTNTLNSTVFNNICSYSPGPLTFDDQYQIPTKGYVDAVASGLSPTTLCNCATTQDISFSGINVPTIIDGITLMNDYRVLVKCQNSSNNVSSSNLDNGIYVYTYDTSGSFSRATDCSGNNVANQLTFISNGSLNGMKAFVQINSPAIAGSQPLNYAPFYSLNYNLGQGLDLSGGSTLQVKSNLNFLTNVKIKNNDILNPALQIANVSETKKINILCDLAGGSYNSITQPGDNGIISCGINSLTPCPLVLTTQESGTPSSGIRITDNSVLLQADLNNYYDLSLTGHNFYGNMYLKTAGTYLQFPDGTRQTTALNNNLNSYSDINVARSSTNTFTNIYGSPGLDPYSNYITSGTIYFSFNGGGGGSGVGLSYEAIFSATDGLISNTVYHIKMSFSGMATDIYHPFSFVFTGAVNITVNINSSTGGTINNVGMYSLKTLRI